MDHATLLQVGPLSESFDSILGISVQLKVVGLLATLPDKEFTGREIASLLHVSHSNVQKAIRTLVDAGFVSVRRIGRADAVRVNREHVAFDAIRALFQLRRGLAERVLKELRSAFRGQRVSLVVFGSYARAEASRSSDLDLLVITNHPAALEARVAVIESAFARKFGLPLSVHLVAAADLRRGRAPAYVRTALDEGILIAGGLPEAVRPRAR